MPPSIRPETVILDELITALTANGLVTDIAPISVVRQISAGLAVSLAEMYYSLWTVYQSYFMHLATGTDLDTRGRDMGLSRDTGQASSGDIRYTRASSYLEDVPLPAPQHVQTVAAPDETPRTYSTIADARLESCGRSISGEAPLQTVTAGVNDAIQLNIDGDGFRIISISTQTTGAAIATAIQDAVRAEFSANPSLQPAYDRFTCDWNTITPGSFTLRSGNPGPSSSVIVINAPAANAAISLKLGTMNGGSERPGQDNVNVPALADVVGLSHNVGAGQITVQSAGVPGILTIANPLPFVDGREPASDDAYRQALQQHILSLGRGTSDGLLNGVEQMRLPSGQQPIRSAQIAPAGDANVAIFIADGRSLTVGAQPDIVQAVQDEVDGRGNVPGGLIPAGATAIVRPATILVIHVSCRLILSRTGPDSVIAQRQAVQVITETLARARVGQTITYMDMLRALDEMIPAILRIDFTVPTAWSITPQIEIPVPVGNKMMPGTITVEVHRA